MAKSEADKAAKKAAKAAQQQAETGTSAGPVAASSNDGMGIDRAGSGGDNFAPKDYVGDLLLITPKSLEEGVKTAYGESDAIRGQVVILNADDPTKPRKVINDGLVFGRWLVAQLKESLDAGTRCLGVLYVDEAGKKPGQSAPYKLNGKVTDDQYQVAVKYLNSLDPLR